MNPNSITNICHEMIRPFIHKESIIIDATLGNGKDTLFLSKYAKHVYAFDIQQEAIIKSKKLNEDSENIDFIHDSFLNFNKYVSKFDGIVFNLGYLPGGDKSITTLAHDTREMLEALFSIKNFSFFVCLVVYTGHKEGVNESIQIEDFLSKNKITPKRYEVTHSSRSNPPYIVLFNIN